MTILHPGSSETKNVLGSGTTSGDDVELINSFLDLGRNIIPGNIFQATLETAITKIIKQNDTLIKKIDYRSGTNTLGIISFCLTFGTVLGSMGKQGKMVLDFFRIIDEVIMKMIFCVMYLSPIGIASIIASKVLGKSHCL